MPRIQNKLYEPHLGNTKFLWWLNEPHYNHHSLRLVFICRYAWCAKLHCISCKPTATVTESSSLRNLQFSPVPFAGSTKKKNAVHYSTVLGSTIGLDSRIQGYSNPVSWYHLQYAIVTRETRSSHHWTKHNWISSGVTNYNLTSTIPTTKTIIY